MEILRLKEELEQAMQEKLDLENEVKSRNEEIYQMNEKLIMNEINSSMTIGVGGEQITDLQAKIVKMQDNNKRRVTDMAKLKQ